jgi:hypothetical protein
VEVIARVHDNAEVVEMQDLGGTKLQSDGQDDCLEIVVDGRFIVKLECGEDLGMFVSVSFWQICGSRRAAVYPIFHVSVVDRILIEGPHLQKKKKKESQCQETQPPLEPWKEWPYLFFDEVHAPSSKRHDTTVWR